MGKSYANNNGQKQNMLLNYQLFFKKCNTNGLYQPYSENQPSIVGEYYICGEPPSDTCNKIMWKMFPYQWLLNVEFHLEPFKLLVRFKIRFMVFSFLEIIPFRTSSIASNYKLLGWIFARIFSFALVVKQSFYFCGSNKVESLLFQAPKANERTKEWINTEAHFEWLKYGF